MDGCRRILHVITGLLTGGAETMLSRVVRSMWPEVESYVIALGQHGAIAEQLVKSGVPVATLGMRRFPTPRQLLSVGRISRNFQPCVIQGWLVHGNLAATSAAVRVTRSRVPLVWNVRQALYDLSYESRLTRLALRLSAKLSFLPDAIVYNSDTAARHHEAIGYPDQKRVIIRNGFDVTRFTPDPQARWETRAKLGINGRVPLIGLVARYHPMKDHTTFIEAAARFVAANNDAQFLLVGADIRPSNPRLVADLERAGVKDRFHLLGQSDETQRLYPAFDILAVSSYTESFPNVLGEAMACGVPCVTTDVGDASTIVGDTGFVVPVRDPDAMSHAWQVMLRDQETLWDRGARARRRIVEHWSLDRVVSQYRDLYQSLTNS